MDVNGRLEQAGDRWRLRFTRHLAQDQETVWRALTEPEHLATWFPDGIRGEWRVGGELRFGHIGTEQSFSGRVLAFEPPSVVEFTWGTDTLRFEVEPDGSSGSLLTLVDTFDEVGKAARDAAGWHVCLDALEQHLAGAEQPERPGERWPEVHEAYVRSFGPEAATIGPPEG